VISCSQGSSDVRASAAPARTSFGDSFRETPTAVSTAPSMEEGEVSRGGIALLSDAISRGAGRSASPGLGRLRLAGVGVSCKHELHAAAGGAILMKGESSSCSHNRVGRLSSDIEYGELELNTT